MPAALIRLDGLTDNKIVEEILRTLIVDSRIQNYTCEGNLRLDSPFIHSLERRVAQVTRNRIKDMIERSQELNTDVMGFGNHFYRKLPADWLEMEANWNEIFPSLPVDVQVEINLMRTGLIKDPIRIE